MVGRGLGMARFPQVERLAEAGWVRVGRQVHLGGDTVVAWRTSTGRIPPGTVQQLGAAPGCPHVLGRAVLSVCA